jgi:hypothetical protein
MTANEGIQTTSRNWVLHHGGPVFSRTPPRRWKTVRNVYEDYEFVERNELKRYGFLAFWLD